MHSRSVSENPVMESSHVRVSLERTGPRFATALLQKSCVFIQRPWVLRQAERPPVVAGSKPG